MIDLQKVSKKWGNESLFEDISVHFPTTGCFGIFGPSGVGKTTLLHLIGGLDKEYQGKILLDGIDWKTRRFSPEDRFTSFAYIFQTFELLEKMTVEENLFVFEQEEKRLFATLQQLGLTHKRKQRVETLSGGEKQRVAIARALLHQPKVLLCDEPTGNIHEEQKKAIYQLLSTIAKTCLVLIVSHDQEGIIPYLEGYYLLKEKHMLYLEKNPQTEVAKIAKKQSKNIFSLRFCGCFIRSHLRYSSVRTMMSFFCFYLTIFMIGMAFFLSTTMSSVLLDRFASHFNERQVILEKKQAIRSERIAIEEQEIHDLLETQDFFSTYGVYYQAPFEDWFSSKNQVWVVQNTETMLLSSFGIRHISEFQLLQQKAATAIYPYRLSKMTNEEIVLGLKRYQVKAICQFLGLETEDEFSLSNWLLQKPLEIRLQFYNVNWDYRFDFTLFCRGFLVEEENTFYHVNPFFHQWLLEEKMQLLTNSSFDTVDTLPWTMKKAFYLEVEKPLQAEAIQRYREQKWFEPYTFELMTKQHQPLVCSSTPCQSGRFLVFYALETRKALQSYVKRFSTLQHFRSYFAFDEAGYRYYPSMMMGGFVQSLFLTSSKSALEQLENEYAIADENLNYLDLNQINLGKALIGTNLISSLSRSALQFKFLDSTVLPFNQIYISRGLSAKMGWKKADTLYMASSLVQLMDAQTFQHSFPYHQVEVADIIEDAAVYFCQNQTFLTNYFASVLEISLAELEPKGFVLEFEKKVDQQKIRSVGNEFISFHCTNPLLPLQASIRQILSFFESTIFVFSNFTFLSSIAMMATVLMLFIKDHYRSIALFLASGFQKKSIFFLLIGYAMILIGGAFLCSSLSILMLQWSFPWLFLEQTFSLDYVTFSPYAAMLGCGLMLLFFTSWIAVRHVFMLSPAQALKELS